MLSILLALPSLASTLPLQSTSWEVNVSGTLADIGLHQVFKNNSDQFIEATYVFPLDSDAAVDDMSIRIGNRTIVAQIETREDAKQAYEDAKKAGKVAGLTEQERPNVFTQSVANIPPGAEVVVDLHIVQPVEWDMDHHELVLPLVVGPRFSPKGTQDVARITPAVSLKPTGLAVNISVDIEAGMHLDWVTSPSHAIDPQLAGTGAAVQLDGLKATRDFVLRWSPRAETATATAIRQGAHVLFQVVPPLGKAQADANGREIVWVVDTSGSMSGAPLDLCKRAMTQAFDTMDARDSFLVMNFANTVSQLAPEPLRATPENIQRGRDFVAGYSGGGGTHMRAGIQAALDLPRDPNRQRYVVFMTDGYIGNEQQILGLINDRVGDTRLMSFGVGSSVNRYLLEEMAMAGQGTSTVVTLDERPEDAVARLLDTISRPVLRDIEIDWGGLKVSEQYPEVIGHLYAGKPLTSMALAHGEATSITVSGLLGNQRYEEEVPVTWAEPGTRAIGTTWARQKVGALQRQQHWGEVPAIKEQIVTTALEYRLLTRYTSFVAIETIVRNQSGEWSTVDQALDLPDGVTFETSVSRRYTPPGDPLLTVHAPSDARSVTALFPWETAHLRWDPLRKRWYHRFLVPRTIPEGEIDVQILIVQADGSVERRTEWMTIDATAPELDVHLVHEGANTVVLLSAEEPFRSLVIQPVGRPDLRQREDIELADDVFQHRFVLPGRWEEVDIVAKDRAMNTVLQRASLGD
jgi:Ca-activated chloride channel family protein